MLTLSLLIDIIFANRCVLCGRIGLSCCEDCWGKLAITPRLVRRTSVEGHSLVGASVIDFDVEVSALMHEFKEAGRSALARQFAVAMAPQLASLVPRDLPTVWLMPVPSNANSIQARGFSPGGVIASAMLTLLEPRFGTKRHNLAASIRLDKGAVWRAAETADQASLGQRGRHTNLKGKMKAAPKVAGRAVVLIDDIVTTGASLFETQRALEAEGAKVLGFVTFSETILRNIGKTHTYETKKV